MKEAWTSDRFSSAGRRGICTLILALTLACAGCGGQGNSAPGPGSSIVTGSLGRQIVFMQPIGAPLAPGPQTIYEIAVMNLDGSGFRQLTNDGKFKFLPHFSPDATKVVYTKYSVSAYGSPSAVYDVAVYDLASGVETMLSHDGISVQGTWSPDGKRIAYLRTTPRTGMWVMNADGSNPVNIADASGAVDDLTWGDIAWGPTNWILFTSAQNINGCFKTRTDKIRPDGSSRTQVSDGGPNCTPQGSEQSGDADPGWSADGATIYSSRGFPEPPAGGPPNGTERKLYAFSSDAWHAGKTEQDLSLASEPSCVEGVPKGSPDGTKVMLFRTCFDRGPPVGEISVTDTSGSYRTSVHVGFGADWNPKQ